MYEFRLGRGIAHLVPFHGMQKELENTPLITNKLIIIMVIVAIAKIAFLILMM